jgi:hypothetical protein
MLCIRVLNLRSCHLRLTLGRAPLCMYIIGKLRRPQVKPPSAIFEQYDPWTELQLQLRCFWICCAVILCKSSLWRGERTQLRRQQRKLWASYYVVPLRSQHSKNNIPTHTHIIPTHFTKYNTRAQYFFTHLCLYGHCCSYTVGDTQHPTTRRQQQQSPTATLDRQPVSTWQLTNTGRFICIQQFKTNSGHPTVNKRQLQ